MRTWLRLLATSITLPLIAVSCGGNPSLHEEGESADASVGGRSQASQTAAPASLRMGVLRAQEKAPGFDFVADQSGILRSHVGDGANVVANASGVRLSSAGAFDFGIATTSVGRTDGTVGSRSVLSRRGDGQELVLTRADAIEERFLAGPLGLEQSYELRDRPAGQGSLVIDVAFDGLVPASVAGATDRVRLEDTAGRVRALYADLTAIDATGRALGSKMEVHGGAVQLVIDDAGATYPLSVDPLVWTLQTELTAVAPAAGAASDLFGSSVAMSGTIAVVGAPDHGGERARRTCSFRAAPRGPSSKS